MIAGLSGRCAFCGDVVPYAEADRHLTEHAEQGRIKCRMHFDCPDDCKHRFRDDNTKEN